MRKQARTWRGVRVARVDPGGTFYARPSAEAGADPEITLCPQPGADECHDGATHVLVHRMKALAKHFGEKSGPTDQAHLLMETGEEDGEEAGGEEDATGEE